MEDFPKKFCPLGSPLCKVALTGLNFEYQAKSFLFLFILSFDINQLRRYDPLSDDRIMAQLCKVKNKSEQELSCGR